MRLDDISVARKLWVALLGVLLTMLLLAFWGLTRYASMMDASIAEVQELENRITQAVRWRGGTELASTLVMGAAVTSDAVLAEQFNARVKQIIGTVGKLQKDITESTSDPKEKAALEKIAAERKQVLEATAKTWELKTAGDVVETQRYADEQLTPKTNAYLKAQEDFVQLLSQQSEQKLAASMAQRGQLRWVLWGAVFVVFVIVVFLARVLVNSITRPLQDAVGAIDAIAAGDLVHDVQSTRKDEFGHMLQSLGQMTERLRGVVGEVRSGVEAVSLASSEIATGNQDLSARTEQTASNLEQTAASMEELTATVTQSADTARQANQLAANAAKAAARGGEVVGQVVASMEQITHSSRKISDIIQVIDGIAFQTNILALNAAVEAARAGEQGRGFAVVASEVRSLAGRSAEAAKEIKQLINTSVENVETGSQQVADAGQSMQDIVASVQRVSDLIGEITASSTEQRDGIAQVNQAVTHLDQMTQQNAALVEESTAAATALRDQAQRLNEVVAVFNVGAQAPAARAPRPAAAAAPVRPPVAASPAKARLAAGKPAVPAAPKSAAAQAPAAAQRIAAPVKAAKPADDEWESF